MFHSRDIHIKKAIIIFEQLKKYYNNKIKK